MSLMACTSARLRRGCATAMHSADCVRCISVARSCLHRWSCLRRRAWRRAGLGCTRRCLMPRCMRFWHSNTRMRALRFLLYGTGCSCVGEAPAHCACGCREVGARGHVCAAGGCSRRACWGGGGLHIRPAVASQIRGASALRDALYRVDWVTLPSCPPPPPQLNGRGWGMCRKVSGGAVELRGPWHAASVASQDHRGAGAGGAGVPGACVCGRGHGLCGAHQATQQLLGVLQGVLGTSGSRTAVWWWSPGVRLPRMPRKTCWTWRVRRCGAWCAAAQSEHPGRLALLDIDTLPVSEPSWQLRPWLLRSLSWACAKTSCARRDWSGREKGWRRRPMR